MKKGKIPVYDICSLTVNGRPHNDFIMERFAVYLSKHYHNLHTPHRHSFFHMVLFTKGSGDHAIDFNKFTVKPYQVYFMIPGQVHRWNFDKDTDGYIINFSESFFRSFLANPDYLDRFDFFNGISEDGVRQLPVETHDKAVSLLEELLLLKGSQNEYSMDGIRLLLLQFFLVVQQADSNRIRKPAPQQKYLVLRRFRQLIDKYYKTIKLPKEYADLLYITPSHLNALCQDLLGKSAGEVIRERIILEGKRLLTSSDTTVSEIAYDLNFQDNSYFSRFFKKYVGVTPETFRKQFINE